MDEMQAEAVGRAFREVLERQTFLFADPADVSDFASDQGDFLAATMGFRGAAEGRLGLAFPEALAAEMAANFLGLDASGSVTPSQRGDCLKELLNVTCGHILTSLRGEEPVFDLSIPEVADVPAADLESWTGSPDVLAFQVDESVVLLTFRFGGQADTMASGKGPQ